jgi:arginase
MNFRKFTPIIAQCYQGQRKRGVELGGDYLYNNVFFKNTVLSSQTISQENFNSTVGYKLLYNTCSTTNYPLVLGGDHSIGTSTVLSSVKKYGPDMTVIWIDAHADINTMKSSLSKNRHGTPLAYATGLDKCWFDESLHDTIDFNKIIYVGIRDLDPFEKEVVAKYNIKHYTPIQAVKFINDTTDSIHISFDVDGLEPDELNSTGTTADNGLNYTDVKDIINASLVKNNLIALDVVEFNPSLGNLKKSLETVEKIFL